MSTGLPVVLFVANGKDNVIEIVPLCEGKDMLYADIAVVDGIAEFAVIQK